MKTRSLTAICTLVLLTGGAVTRGEDTDVAGKTGSQLTWTAETAAAGREQALRLLGPNGFAVIRNAAEEKVFLNRLEQAGITVERPHHERTTPWASFARGMQMVSWRDLTSADTLRITGARHAAGSRSGIRDTLRLEVEIMAGDAGKNVQAWKACCAWIPRTARLEVAGAGKDEIWTADAQGRDVADGLQACLAVTQTGIQPGEDITLTMSLRNARPAGGGPIVVWDNKYSNGYRADFYLVGVPDGTSRILRRPVQDAWEKNAPAPVEIQPGASWTLGGIAHDEIVKSLRSLGLDTTQKGIYTVTGYYEADGYQGDRVDRARGFWGGLIATPPVDIAVGGAQFHRIEPEQVKPAEEPQRAEAGKNPPSATAWQDLFAGENWYTSEAGKETVFTGTLEAVPQAGGASTLQRNSYYKLGDRAIYTAARRIQALDRLVGQTVEIRGKPMDMELEGQDIKEIWPAAIRTAK